MSSLHRAMNPANVVEPVMKAVFGRMFEHWAQANAPWMQLAHSQLGVRESKGSRAQSEPQIIEYLESCWYTAQKGRKWADLGNDNTAWCSAFVNWCLLRTGIRGTGNTWSLSWLDWKGGVHLGTDLTRAPIGSIIVLDGGARGPNLGHVAFLWSMEGGKPYYLGGNQGDGTLANRASDRVSICHYKNKVKQCIWPIRPTGPIPKPWAQGRPV